MQNEAATTGSGTGKRRAFVIVSVVFGLAAGFGLFGFPSLFISWFGGREGGIHRVHDLASGAVFGILIGAAFLIQAVHPERKIALMQQVGLTVVAFIVAGALSAEPAALGFDAALAVVWAVLFVLHPVRQEIIRWPRGWSMPLIAIVVLGAVPLVVAAIDWAELQRTLPASDPHVEELHWATMAGWALSLILVGLVAAARTAGWRIVAWSVAASAAVVGLASIVFPDHPGSVGTAWGVLTMVGAALFAAVAEWEARREATREPQTRQEG